MEKDYLLIDQYFLNQLSDGEKESFENRIANDKTFAEEVAFYLHAKSISREVALKEKHESWTKQEKPKTRVLSIKTALSIAATVLLIFFAWQLFGIKKPSIDENIDKYASTTFASLPLNMDTGADSLTMAINLYNNKDYSGALTVLQGLKQANALKYAGKSAFNLNRYDQASKYFQQYSLESESTKATGEFLMALAMIKEGNIENAKEILKNIKSEDLDLESRKLLKLILK